MMPTSGWSIASSPRRIMASAGAATGSTSPAMPTATATRTTSTGRTAYRYRDFVIRAFNDDMPFDQFVRWQIAGDEYEPDNPRALAATGLLHGRAQPGDDAGRHRREQGENPLRRAGQHALDRRLGPARPDDRLRPLPRPQVRSDPDPRLLPHARGVHDLDPARSARYHRPHRDLDRWLEEQRRLLSRRQDEAARPGRRGEVLAPAARALLRPGPDRALQEVRQGARTDTRDRSDPG